MRLHVLSPLLLPALISSNPTTACASHQRAHHPPSSPSPIPTNNASRPTNPPPNITLTNVRVFNGHTILPPSTIYLSAGLITNRYSCPNATHIDGRGFTLLPGLIDSHCHPTSIAHLEELARHGVTSGLTMSCLTSSQCASLANHPGLTDLKYASAPASAPGSAHGNIAASVDPTLLLHNASEIPAWLDRQLAMSPEPDYIKLIAETPGFAQSMLNILVSSAQERGKKTVTHASTLEAYTQAILSGTHHIHHVPLDAALPSNSPLLTQMKRVGQVATPTLTMMRSISRIPSTYNATALLTTHTLHTHHIPLLAGTDANEVPGVPAAVPFGSSLHDELFNLVEAGLSNVEALRAATVVPARYFGLRDRGEVREGLRADLVLVEGDPVAELEAVRRVRGVWVEGVRVEGVEL
ncbi:hypothetical protein K458DRAFT_20018 [Lentithecium fluviatile CBS 122367]|uniref:Amidohydrolase-related domain-containing protein n=1 Tax=Lentithecium fluviatile CBS 122367 TaxID=1168545 RepID=A0A6G1J4B5_9PLEO|nr:hypothetical protein K458DRAFT_20018 [Lentithecium fluviatile CBS 122367]